MNEIKVGDRVRLNANGSFTLPRVVEVTNNEVILQRKYKGRPIGKLTVPKYRVVAMDKSFRNAKYSCTILSRI